MSFQTIKMEDLEIPNTPHSSESRSSSIDPSESQGSSCSPDSSRQPDGKPTKKRKSWGQVLPEPKTNLPPRKRAKTEDEKEQRRIERVRRNRLAAHNSRERKRLEVERLQDDKDDLERYVKSMEERMKAMEAELILLRQGIPSLPSCDFKPQIAMTPPASEPLDSLSAPASTNVTPLLSSIASPPELSTPLTPPALEMVTDPEQTQHSAAMLCEDLPCRSGSITQSRLNHRLIWWVLNSTLTASLTSIKTWTSICSTPLRRRASTQATALLHHQIILLSLLTSCFAPLTPTSRNRLEQVFSNCSPAQARLLMSATGKALLRKTTSKSFHWDRLSGADGSSSLDMDNSRCRTTLARRMAAKRSLLRDVRSSCRNITRSGMTSRRRQSLSSKWDL